MTTTLGKDNDRAAEYCTYCPKLCRFNCPVAEAEHRETVTPWGLMRLTHLLRTEAVEPSEALAEVLHHCTGCRRCETWCAHHNDVPAALWAARGMLHDAGHTPEVVDAFIGTFDAHGAPAPQPALDAEDVAEIFDPESDIAYFPDCGTRAHDPELVLRVGMLLEHLIGRKVRLSTPTGCCGAPLLAAGDRLGFEHQRRLFEEAHADVALVLTDCAEVTALYREGTSHGEPREVEVRHLIELIAELGPDTEPEAQIEADGLVLHDSCTLGRQLQLYDQTRVVAGLIFGDSAAELHLSRDQATCCGAGGLYPIVAPEGSDACARALLEQTELEGGDAIICGQGGCARKLRQVSGEDVAMDLIEAACMAYGF